MKMLNIARGPQNASAVVLGCMRMPSLSAQEAAAVLRTAAEESVNFYDHATCYGNGEAETRFGEAFARKGVILVLICLVPAVELFPEAVGPDMMTISFIRSS